MSFIIHSKPEKISSIIERTKSKRELSKIVNGFTQIPNWFLVSSDYSVYDKMTYIMIKKYKMNKTYCWPSVSTLAKRIGCSESSVKKATKNLIRRGLIEKGKNKKIRSNIYYPKI